MKKNNLILIALLSLQSLLFGKEEETVETLPIGNFSVPTATQISPLLGFGQLLVGENIFFPQITGTYSRGHSSSFNVIAPSVTYGVRDDLALFFLAPFDIRSRDGSSHSSGIRDVLLQAEYGFYFSSGSDYTCQSTVVANVQFPTGSSSKSPPTGAGSFSYFLGTTYAYTSFNWFAFVSPGANLTTRRHGTKFGNSFLYQCGFARYIKQLSPQGWVFDLMLEFEGAYTVKDRIHGKTNPDSGGNVIFATPSLWLSSNRVIIQWGIGFPILQKLNGHQDKIRYSIDYNLGIAVQF